MCVRASLEEGCPEWLDAQDKLRSMGKSSKDCNLDPNDPQVVKLYLALRDVKDQSATKGRVSMKLMLDWKSRFVKKTEESKEFVVLLKADEPHVHENPKLAKYLKDQGTITGFPLTYPSALYWCFAGMAKYTGELLPGAFSVTFFHAEESSMPSDCGFGLREGANFPGPSLALPGGIQAVSNVTQPATIPEGHQHQALSLAVGKRGRSILERQGSNPKKDDHADIDELANDLDKFCTKKQFVSSDLSDPHSAATCFNDFVVHIGKKAEASGGTLSIENLPRNAARFVRLLVGNLLSSETYDVLPFFAYGLDMLRLICPELVPAVGKTLIDLSTISRGEDGVLKWYPELDVQGILCGPLTIGQRRTFNRSTVFEDFRAKLVRVRLAHLLAALGLTDVERRLELTKFSEQLVDPFDVQHFEFAETMFGESSEDVKYCFLLRTKSFDLLREWFGPGDSRLDHEMFAKLEFPKLPWTTYMRASASRVGCN